MADIRIKELTELTELTDNDYFVVDNSASGGETKKYRATRVTEMIDAVAEEIEEKITPSIDTALAVGSASGDIASFSDGSNLPMPKLEVAIEPQQDLHGYDAPWVGGAGKNKFDSDTVLSAFTKNNNKYVGMPSYVADNYVISGGFKTNTRYTLSYKAYNNTSTPSNFRFIFSYTDETEEIIGGFVDTTTEKVIVGTSAENKTISKIKRNYGNGVEFTLYDIQLEEGSTATSYAPYSNICPISGWSAVNRYRTGINVWDEEWEVGSISDASGQDATNSNYRRSKSYISVKANKKYYFNVPSKYGTTYRFYQYKQNKDYIGIKTVDSDGTFETDNDCAFIRFRIATTEDYTNDISINYPSTDTSYHAYNGHTTTIDLNGTRYGGKLDVVSGVMTITHGYVDLGSINWTYQATNKVFYTIRISDYLFNSSVSAICSQYGYIGTVGGGTASLRDDEYNGKCAFYYLSTGVSREFYIKDLAYDDATAFKTAMNGVQLVYELATPLTIQLTPTQVKSLLGQNNVWCDTGEIIDCEYKRDATAIINSLIARIEALENQ